MPWGGVAVLLANLRELSPCVDRSMGVPRGKHRVTFSTTSILVSFLDSNLLSLVSTHSLGS